MWPPLSSTPLTFFLFINSRHRHHLWHHSAYLGRSLGHAHHATFANETNAKGWVHCVDAGFVLTTHAFFRTASALVQWMIHYFRTTLLPAFHRLRRAAAAPQPQPVRSLYRHPGTQEPLLTAPPLAIPRDSAMRVPSNPYSDFESSRPSTSPCSAGFPP